LATIFGAAALSHFSRQKPKGRKTLPTAVSQDADRRSPRVARPVLKAQNHENGWLTQGSRERANLQPVILNLDIVR
jgi:hypothetical protein